MKRHYFDHDYSARNDQKILALRFKHGFEGYGLYWAILETMAEDSTGHLSRGALGGLSISLGTPLETLEKNIEDCIKIGLFGETPDHKIFSGRMLEHKSLMQDFSNFGKKGVRIREANRGALRGASSPSSSKEIRGEEIRVKEKREEKSKSVPAAPTPPPVSKFLKPSVEEILAYCDERENRVDPQKFYDHYESNGWRVGRNPMKDWKAAVRTWERSGYDSGAAGSGDGVVEQAEKIRQKYGSPK